MRGSGCGTHSKKCKLRKETVAGGWIRSWRIEVSDTGEALLLGAALVLLYMLNLNHSQAVNVPITGGAGLQGTEQPVIAPGTTGVGTVSQNSAGVAIPFSGGTNPFSGVINIAARGGPAP